MIRVAGHRGAAGRAPENTAAAIRLAWEIGVDLVEIDVHLTADGHPVLLHDATLDRTTSGAGPVADRTLDELRALDAGSWFDPAFAGERVPALAEVLSSVGGTGTRWLVELKRGHSTPERLVEGVLAAIHAAGAAEQVRLISFDDTVLAEARRQAPAIPRGFIRGQAPLPFQGRGRGLGAEELLAAAERLECAAVHPSGRLLTPELIAAARAAGRVVNTWTLNDADSISRAARLEVDEITTDFPDLALALLRQMEMR